MSLRLHCFISFVLALAIGLIQAAGAQNPGAAPAAPATHAVSTGVLHGHITDPTGALIPGAQIVVTTVTGTPVGNATADAAGGYQVRGLSDGSYVVQVNSDGFAEFVSSPISLTAGQTKTVDVKMSVETAQQQVVVTDEGAPQVSVEAGDNASAVVIKGKDLDALSDDPDELSNELSALAGPAAGPNGGQIYIDGFTAGELPPKSAIREIRINQNPFSAEFDRLGYGRIEILTKPGTDKLHGRTFVQGNDDAFNTGNPFTTIMPSYHSIQFNGTVSGPINKNASYFFSAEQRDNQNDSVYQATTAVAGTGAYVQTIQSGSVFSPTTHTNISPRLDLQLGAKNTLTLRYQFFRNTATNSFGGGGFGAAGGSSSISEPNVATDTSTIEHQLQLSDSYVINDRIVNETRAQYLRDISTVTPLSGDPNVSVPGYFVNGGSTSQSENDHTDHFELQNITTMSAGAHAIKFGTRLRDGHDVNTTNTYFNGAFSFASLDAYINELNYQNFGTACPDTEAEDCGPNKLTYYMGNLGAQGNVFDAALFFQDDWKKNKYMTLSFGVRWEAQNHISDHDDWGPRLAFAYALDGHKSGSTTKTVLRGGYGFFFNRLNIGTLMSAERYDGKPGSQQQIVINYPTCFSQTSLNSLDAGNINNLAAACGSSSNPQQINTIAHDYHSPVDEQVGVSLERQVTRTMTFTTTYLHTLGVHQVATIDANAYLPNLGTFYYNSTTGPTPGVRPNTNFGPIDENFPEAIYKQNQIIFNVNARITPRLTLGGFYNLNWANADTGTASNSYDISQDYGRATFASRQQLFLMSSYTGPWGITFNPFLQFQTGRPFDIATSEDLTGDNFIGQDRPTFATASSPTADVIATKYGTFNTAPLLGETIIPANLGTGPHAMAVNLRVARTFGVGPKIETAANSSRRGQGGGQGGPPGGFGGIGFGGGGRGGPGGGGPPGGGGGGPFGANAASNYKYTLNFSVQALNVFNQIDLGTPNGTLTPPPTGLTAAQANSRFDVSTSLAGGIYSSGAAARRIFAELAFQF